MLHPSVRPPVPKTPNPRLKLQQSIQNDPTNPKLFTNRAMARLKLQNWEDTINDCLKSIELEHGQSMKGFYYLAQAQLALKRPNEAYCSAITAYERCIETNDKSAGAVSALVLQAKKLKWEIMEKERVRGRSELLREAEEALGRVKRGRLRRLDEGSGEEQAEEEREEIEEEYGGKIEELRSVFAIADPVNLQRRVCLL